MPTTYTHDLFGKIVYQRLPSRLHDLVSRHIPAYRAGLQGPDILFYYVPIKTCRVNELGTRMHHEEAAEFFRKLKGPARADEELAAYCLGFVCHFMLDSTCHPYINEYAKKTGAAHDEIESELDRKLMERTGENPFSYHPADGIETGSEFAGKLTAVFPELTAREIHIALCSMQRLTGFLVCRTRIKRELLLGAMKIAGAYSFQGHVIRKEPLERCRRSTEELTKRIKLAVPETVSVIGEYWAGIQDDGEIPARFARDYE